MARVKMIKPEEADAETRKVYDGVVRQWGRISNFSQVLAHQPAALAGWMLPNEAIRLANVKSDPDYVKIQQLVIIKTSALNRSAYCMSHNVPLGTEDRAHRRRRSQRRRAATTCARATSTTGRRPRSAGPRRSR